MSFLPYFGAFVASTALAVTLLLLIMRYEKKVRAWALLLLAGIKLAVALFFSPVLIVLFYTWERAFLFLMTWLWPHNDIMSEKDGLYLRRFYLTPRFKGCRRIFLHYIRLSDSGRAPHDHPWDFKSRILKRGYDEKIYYPKDQFFRTGYGLWHVREVRAGDVVNNKAEHVHMVTLIGPTWSFVIAGPKRHDWGFWELDPIDASKDRWVDERIYLGKGAEVKSWLEDVQ